MEIPDVMAHEAIHKTVERILTNATRGKVLDIPAGGGALAARLKELGFEVSCCDLYPTIFKQPEMEIRAGDLDVLP